MILISKDVHVCILAILPVEGKKEGNNETKYILTAITGYDMVRGYHIHKLMFN